MSAVGLIAVALAAGASTGLKDPSAAGVRDAYQELKDLLRHRFQGRDGSALDGDEIASDGWQAQIGDALARSGAVDDAHVLAAARRLLALADPDAATALDSTPDQLPSSTYQVDAGRAKGVQVGDHGVQHNTYIGSVTLPGRAPVTWPILVGALPPLADRRVDRPIDQELADAVSSAGGSTAGQVLSGLGGIGKTQIVAALAHRLWHGGEVDLLVWITASSRTAIVTGLTDAAGRVTGVDDTDPEHGAVKLLGWLTEPHQRRWLIVLDDLDDPADLTGLWPPVSADGHTVVTTRHRDAALMAGRHRIDVDVFTPAQAIDYLSRKLAGQAHRLEEGDRLAHDLGYLPIALAQAVAYILDRGARMTCAAYRKRLKDQRRRLADTVPDALPDQHARTVAATWSVSIENADARVPVGVALPVLELAALLDANGIPVAALTTAAFAAYCTRRLDRPVTAEDVDEALYILHRFNLLTVDDESQALRVHALLQRAVRDATDHTHHGGLVTAAADALIEIWPEPERDAAQAQTLRVNVSALQECGGDALWQDGVHPVIVRAGRSLGDAGLVRAAADHFKQVAEFATSQLGPLHPDTLGARHHFARWLGQAGNLTASIAAFEVLLPDRREVLGEDHPDTLETRRNLARWLGHAGHPARAVEDLEALVEAYTRVLGADCPDTLTTRYFLARWRGYANDPAGAVRDSYTLFDDRLRVLGPDHPDTLATRHDIARWTGAAGDPVEGLRLSRELLPDRVRILGPDHPDTLITRSNIANWLRESGSPADAARIAAELLEDRIRILGADHPDTLTSRNDLASCQGEAGDPGAAAVAYEQLLEDRLRVLGAEHPDTVATGRSLVYWSDRAAQGGC